MFGKLDDTEIEALLHRQVVARLGCHADGVTYVIPMSYAYDGDYFYCRSFEGLKLQMLRKNPDICVQVDDTRNLSNWKSVVCWGTFEELKNGEERQHAIRLLSDRVLPLISSQMMRISPEWPFTPGNEHDVQGIFFRIKINQKTGRFEKTNADIFYAT